MLISLTPTELWVIQECVRDDKEAGRCWSTLDMAEVHRALLATADEDAPMDVDVSEDFLWHIENQVKQSLMVRGEAVGRSILRKVFQVLADLTFSRTPIYIPPDLTVWKEAADATLDL